MIISPDNFIFSCFGCSISFPARFNDHTCEGAYDKSDSSSYDSAELFPSIPILVFRNFHGAFACCRKKMVLVVLDNGGGEGRLGFAGETRPRTHNVNAVAYPRKTGMKPAIGDEEGAVAMNSYNLVRPLQAGLLTDRASQVLIWQKAFFPGLLGKSQIPKDLVITEPFVAPNQVHFELLQAAFEDLGVDRCVILQSQTLIGQAFPQYVDELNTRALSTSILDSQRVNSALNCTRYSAEIFPGHEVVYRVFHEAEVSSDDQVVPSPARLAVDLGYSACWALPTYRNLIIDYAVYRTWVSGFALDKCLKRALCFRNIQLTGVDLTVQNIRESKCYVAQNFFGELEKISRSKDVDPTTWVDQPKGSKREHIAVPEILFQPELFLGEPIRGLRGEENIARTIELWHHRVAAPISDQVITYTRGLGISDLIVKSIFSTPPILQSAFAESILLSKAKYSTMFLPRRRTRKYS